jgi:hypothetical protein
LERSQIANSVYLQPILSLSQILGPLLDSVLVQSANGQKMADRRQPTAHPCRIFPPKNFQRPQLPPAIPDPSGLGFRRLPRRRRPPPTPSAMSQPVTPRRVTRSSAADPALRTSPSNNSRPKSTTRRQPVPTDAAKEEGEHERSTVDAILEALPGRRAQAMDLLRLLAPAPALLLLLHGGAATGKTRALPSSLFATCAPARVASPTLPCARSRPLALYSPPSSPSSARLRQPPRPLACASPTSPRNSSLRSTTRLLASQRRARLCIWCSIIWRSLGAGTRAPNFWRSSSVSTISSSCRRPCSCT